jgi:flagellar motility protein MotE (MotC chaperone)
MFRPLAPTVFATCVLLAAPCAAEPRGGSLYDARPNEARSKPVAEARPPTPPAKAETAAKPADAAKQDASKQDASKQDASKQDAAKQEAPPPDSPLAAAYCRVAADSAAEARIAYQAQRLKELEAKLAEQTARLAEKQAELRGWMERQEAARAKAQGHLADILAKMKPEAASAQLVAMDEASAAALLAKMPPRTVSAILNETAPAKAARLSLAMPAPAPAAPPPSGAMP